MPISEIKYDMIMFAYPISLFCWFLCVGTAKKKYVHLHEIRSLLFVVVDFCLTFLGNICQKPIKVETEAVL